jgi:phosphonate transport system ATP-binding protein
VSKTFANGVKALSSLDLTFPKGQIAVVLGPSGSGKSTLLRLANGLELPSAGEVRVDGMLVEPKVYRSLRKRVGMVFQQFNLVPRLSVMANVLCGRLAYRSLLTDLFFVFPESDFELARSALDRVGLGDRAWDRVDKLSGGQQQRVAIARTLVQECEFLLADEPVASLDPAIGEGVMELLTSVARDQGTGLILNLHQVDLARRYAERIVCLRRGEVFFDGLPDDLTDAVLEELYRSS